MLTIRERVVDIQVERMQNESLSSYHRRLIFGKLVDKTLSDMDYSELSELVYGQTFSSDVARRMMYGSRRTLELLEADQSAALSGDVLSEIDSKLIELQKERQKFFDQRREYNKLISADGRKEHLYDHLTDAANNLPDTIGALYSKDLRVASVDKGNEAILVLCDWHYGMTTDNVFNTYNTDVCKQRVKQVVDKAKERIILNQCSKLHIAVLGDLFHGAIHTSARVASEELVCDQLMQSSEILAQSIIELSKCVDKTFVYVTYGNHSRTIPNKNDSIHRDNLERLVPWWLEQRINVVSNLSDIPLNIHIMPDTGSEFLFINSCGHEICASHGDLDSVKSSPRLLATLFQKKYGKDIDYILLADKHHRESFDELGITAMVCGSLCGTDDYANSKRLFSDPSQLLLIVNKENGVDGEYRLKCV